MSLFRLPPLSRSLSLLAAPRGFSIAFLHIHYVSLCSVSLSLFLSFFLSLSPPTPRKTILLFLSLHAFLFLFPSLFVAWLLFSLFCFPPLSLFIFPAYPSSPPRCFSSFFPLFPPFRVSFRSCVRSEGEEEGGWVHVAAGITERCFDSCFNGCSAYTRLTRPDAFQFSRNASQHAGSLERSHAPTRENRINCKRRRGYIAHNC